MRVPEWEFRLIEQVEAAAAEGFVFGRNDCLYFALRCVEAVTGVMPKCPKYKTAKQARIAFGRLGIDTLGDYLAQHFTELESPLLAMRGDVAVIAQNGDQACVVNVGDGWVGRGEHGTVRVPLRAVTRCFKVQ